jgi:hypothetical protein
MPQNFTNANPYHDGHRTNVQFQYDDALLSIDSGGMHRAALAISAAIESVVGSAETVFAAMGELSLGWGGKTEREATEFGQRWKDCTDLLFGPDKEHPGLVDQLNEAVRAASVNYALTEQDITQMWKKFTDQLEAGMKSKSSEGTFTPVQAQASDDPANPVQSVIYEITP